MWSKNLEQRVFRVAVVGTGKMGLLHSSILSTVPNVKVTALCEKSGSMRRILKKTLREVQIVDDVKKLSGLDLDAVFVTTPIPSHCSVVKALIEAEVAGSLFIEKTLAANYAEAKEMCKLVDGSNGANMVGYLRRFCVTFGKAKDLLFKGAIGDTVSFAAYAYSSDFCGVENKKAMTMSRGGVLKDLGCHAVDLALWFFGDLEVCSSKSALATTKNSKEHLNFSVESSRGVEGNCSVSWRMKDYRMPEVGFSIAGSRGSIQVNDDRVELRVKEEEPMILHRQDLNDNVPFWLGLPEYYREDLYFVQSIAERRNAEPSFQSASKVDQIIDQVEKRTDEKE